jgi:hypothetical protein
VIPRQRERGTKKNEKWGWMAHSKALGELSKCFFYGFEIRKFWGKIIRPPQGELGPKSPLFVAISPA